MAANKKPRKKYRPKPKMADPLTYAMQGNQRLHPDHIRQARDAVVAALQAFAEDRGGLPQWKALTGTVNVALALAEASSTGGYGHEYFDDLEHAQMALCNMGKRWKQWGKWQATEQELALLDHAIVVHEAQLAAVTVRDVELAQELVWRRERDPNIKLTIHDQPGMYKLKETVTVPA